MPTTTRWWYSLGALGGPLVGPLVGLLGPPVADGGALGGLGVDRGSSGEGVEPHAAQASSTRTTVTTGADTAHLLRSDLMSL